MDWSWAVEGITESMPRTTGPECAGFLTAKRKVLEGIFVTGISVWILKWTIPRIRSINILIPHHPHQLEPPPPLGKQILLVTMTFILGMEMGFKLSTKTVIFALNPCHITTIIQLYLLAAKPSKTTTALFRIQMNYLNGPFLAFLFPDAESRLLPFEEMTYWIQHGLLFIIPIYLLRLGGAYQMEHILDFKWNALSYGLLCIYHFTFLQLASVISNVNLNQMLCASISDPFDGPNYRMYAFVHQGILCPFLCKLFTVLFANTNQVKLDVKIIKNNSQNIYSDYDYNNQNNIATAAMSTSSSSSSSAAAAAAMGGIASTPPNLVIPTIGRIDDQIMTTKID